MSPTYWIFVAALNGFLGWNAWQMYQERRYWQDFVATCISSAAFGVCVGFGTRQ
jgi:hypothetical protein